MVSLNDSALCIIAQTGSSFGLIPSLRKSPQMEIYSKKCIHKFKIANDYAVKLMYTSTSSKLNDFYLILHSLLPQ